jgi:hypothetical protein
LPPITRASVMSRDARDRCPDHAPWDGETKTMEEHSG